ncbi:hypothetical protein BDR05DRAFT_994957 [Suillus weaverae]|nr:hypothetical protein BDR05DRAFT_994957 [Suillus weaverae]
MRKVRIPALLEYLKQLHPVEWDNFIKDTKILAEESAMFNSTSPFGTDEKGQSKMDDLPFYCIGFKSAAPEYTLQTRIWASLHAQTLYLTVSGMMNYAKAIKLLYHIENTEVVQQFGGNTDKLEHELECMAQRKFKFVVSMQRHSKFNKEEHENAEFLLHAYPDLQVAYLDEETLRKEGGELRLSSALIDGHSEFIPETGHHRPNFRIELPGNPILGDGKWDNQNHDNYLEECLKIHNILGEFKEYSVSTQSPYAQYSHKEFKKSPVAIIIKYGTVVIVIIFTALVVLPNPEATHTNDPTATVLANEPPIIATLILISFACLPPIAASMSQLSQTLDMPVIKPITMSTAILMTIIFAYTHTKLGRFRHAAGVLLQFIEWNIIITYNFIYAIVVPGLSTASFIIIGCILFILVIVLADIIFWAVVAYKCSEEQLGLYGQVQHWLFNLMLGLFAVICKFFKLLVRAFTCHDPGPFTQETQTGMTPPPLYSLYDTEVSIYRLSDVDKV